jgi:hypothetical protein
MLQQLLCYFYVAESDTNTLNPIHQAHAMQYVVKVRNRYLDKPEVYRYNVVAVCTQSIS